MSTGFGPQYQQYPQYQGQTYYAAASYCAAPSTANAVNIQIFNPTANAGPVNQNAQYPQYQQQAPMPLYQTSSIYGQNGQTPAVSYPMNYNAPVNTTNNYNSQPVVQNTAETPKEAEKKEEKTKEKVILTDDYIKSLENYLNNQDAKIRLTAAKELLDRFKEDETRKADPALTALLNKVLQDPKASVRYIGLTTLDVGYAQGDNETVNILQQLQNRPDLEYGEDSVLASQILLKMSGQKVTVPDTSSEGAK